MVTAESTFMLATERDDRLRFLAKNAAPCPKCFEHMQLAVTDWSVTPAQWLCRTCKHKFEYEPQIQKITRCLSST